MIAIIGATGYIGRSIARIIAAEGTNDLVLFARNPAAHPPLPKRTTIKSLTDFDAGPFDLVINAIGAGDPARVKSLGVDILDVTNIWDLRVLNTMSPSTRYVFLSSGAVHSHVADTTKTTFSKEAAASAYVAGKLAAEERHRGAPRQAILDVRVFGYADESISLDGTSFLADLARSVAHRQELVTSRDDMMRDYAGALELWNLICRWLEAGAPNSALDLYTLAPVSKNELIEHARSRYDIPVRYSERVQASPTGLKPNYASTLHSAGGIGYAPGRTSLEVVAAMLDVVAKAKNQ